MRPPKPSALFVFFFIIRSEREIDVLPILCVNGDRVKEMLLVCFEGNIPNRFACLFKCDIYNYIGRVQDG